jgi:hypothetical protein
MYISIHTHDVRILQLPLPINESVPHHILALQVYEFRT